LLQVAEQAGNGVVGFAGELGGELGVVALDVDVAIPAPLVLHAAGVDLDEADAALDHPPGDQALAGDVAAARVVEAIERFDVGGLALHVRGLGKGRTGTLLGHCSLPPPARLLCRRRWLFGRRGSRSVDSKPSLRGVRRTPGVVWRMAGCAGRATGVARALPWPPWH
jgi:hypothetical protein